MNAKQMPCTGDGAGAAEDATATGFDGTEGCCPFTMTQTLRIEKTIMMLLVDLSQK